MRTTIASMLILIVGAAPMAHAQAKKKAAQKHPVIAVFNLDGPILEKPVSEDLPFMSVGGESLKSLTARMKKAADDKNVKAVVVLLGNTGFGYGQLQEMRQAMDQIKKSGKKIYSHADYLSLGSYAFLSGASELSVVPTGHVMILGQYGEQPYLRGLLDKIGVTPDFLTCGDYKSAGEIFTRATPSPEADKMNNWLFDGLYAESVNLIATGRGVDKKKTMAWIDSGVYSAESAAKAGIIDAAEDRSRFEAKLKAKYGIAIKFDKSYGKKKGMSIDLSSPFGIMQFYAQLLSPPRVRKSNKNSVAIIYLQGAIMPGSPAPSPLGPLGGGGGAYSTPLRKALDKAANDRSVKAVVLRVDSPGGSAVASEIILRATQRVADKKPLIVSMGDIAGSGGYYVSCAAKTVFANPSTVTGSIGVVTGKFATTDMWKKIGVNFKTYKRGANAGLLSSESVFTDQERDTIQGWMDEVYEVFKGHVVKIRGDRLKKDIDELAGGRVYTGRQALDLGLVDKMGGLDDAIAFAAKEARLDDYEVRVIPRTKNILEVMMSDLTGGSDSDDRHLSLLSGPARGLRSSSLFEQALPYLKGLDQRRVLAIKRAFMQLDMIQKHRVLLLMPELNLRN